MTEPFSISSPVPWGRRDVYIAIAMLVVAWIGCRLYMPAFRADGGRAQSYFDQFGPAVMEACGRGFVNPSLDALPSLQSFLLEGSDTFDCRLLSQRTDIEPLNDFQSVTRNLLHAAAAVWRVTGVSWNALDSLAATMFSVTMTVAYVVMRFILGRSLALLGTVAWGISPLHLSNVPDLRDYSKAPFFLFTALAIAVAIRAQRPKALVALGAVFGMIQGLGLGMRTDVVLNFFPFFLVLFTLGSGEAGKNVPWKVATAAVSLTTYVLVAWPVLTTYAKSEGLWHVSLLGLTTPFDSALNIRRAPYAFGYLYDDSYMSTVVQAYWSRVHGPSQVSLHGAGLYETACRAYYALLASTFPADFLTRMAGSALHVLNLPFSISYGIVPRGIQNPVLTWVSKARAFVIPLFAGTGPIAAAYLLVLIGVRHRIGALVGFVVLMFWATYPYLQFHERHVFHLEILILVVLLWAAQLSWRLLAAARDPSWWRRGGKRALQSSAMIGALVGVGVLSVASARLMQEPKARALLMKYDNASAEPLDVQNAPDGKFIRLSPALFEPAEHRPRIQQAMLVLNASAACDVADIPVHVRYSGDATPVVDFSRDLTVRIPGRAVSSRVFLPVYSIETREGHVSRFSSIDVAERMASCIRLTRAREAEHLPLMLDVALLQNWQTEPLHERLYLGSIMPERVWLRFARWWPRIAALG